MTDWAIRPTDPLPFPGELADTPHNLPEQLTSFIGRSRELNQLAKLLEEHRLVTLVGTGGVGKSRLAIEAARHALKRFPDGVWLVNLAEMRDPTLVMRAVATVVGVIEGPLRPLAEALSEILRPRALLLVLDNCEHLLEASAEQGVMLTQCCPYLRILATSQEPLGIAGEWLLQVRPMTTPPPGPVDPYRLRANEAARLFAERARATQADFELSDAAAPAVAEICRGLDGLPLALELAASRLRTMTLEEVAAGLDQRFQLFTSGPRTALPRHRTLRGMVDWSVSLLDDQQRVLLRRLAVFAGGWTREAASTICADDLLPDSEVNTALDALVDRSLVTLDDWHGASRYRLLETIRAYALETLHEVAEEAVQRQRHAGYFLDMLADAPRDATTDQLAWMTRMDAEIDNLRVALDWATLAPKDAERALHASMGLWLYFDIRGNVHELVSRYEALLACLPPDEYSPGRLLGETLLCHSLGMLGRLEQAITIFARTLTHAPSVDDPWSRFFCTLIHLQWLQVTGSPQVQAAAQELTDVDYEALIGPHIAGIPIWWRGEALVASGHLEEARTAFEEALKRLRFERERGFLHRNLGMLAFHAGDLETAARQLRASLEIFNHFRDLRHFAVNVEQLACIASGQGQWERAACLLGASEMLFGLVSTVSVPHWQLGTEVARERSLRSLGEGRYQAMYARGRALSVDGAVAYALELGDTNSTSATSEVEPSPLTPRELEVAQLVAQGLSNAEIARTMVVSRKTVESHVAHALAKLGLRSRASLAVWAARHQ